MVSAAASFSDFCRVDSCSAKAMLEDRPVPRQRGYSAGIGKCAFLHGLPAALKGLTRPIPLIDAMLK